MHMENMSTPLRSKVFGFKCYWKLNFFASVSQIRAESFEQLFLKQHSCPHCQKEKFRKGQNRKSIDMVPVQGLLLLKKWHSFIVIIEIYLPIKLYGSRAKSKLFEFPCLTYTLRPNCKSRSILFFNRSTISLYNQFYIFT